MVFKFANLHQNARKPLWHKGFRWCKSVLKMQHWCKYLHQNRGNIQFFPTWCIFDASNLHHFSNLHQDLHHSYPGFFQFLTGRFFNFHPGFFQLFASQAVCSAAFSGCRSVLPGSSIASSDAGSAPGNSPH